MNVIIWIYILKCILKLDSLQAQKEKLTHAFQNKTGVTLELNANQLNGSDIIGLTKTQHNQIKRAKKGVTIKLSKTQVSKQRGILGTILASLVGTLLPSLLRGKSHVLPGSKKKSCLTRFEKIRSCLLLWKTCVWTRFNSWT